MMPREGKKFGHKGGTQFCPGYYDEHSQWNNGFDCPKWGRGDEQYCCGSERHHYCCPPEETPQKLGNGLREHIPLIICLAIGALALLAVAVVIICYFCSCCWAYKRRKRLRTGLNNSQHQLATTRGGNFAVNYSVCPDRSFFPDIPRPPSYPTDDPPPYPGDEDLVSSPQEDKQPLHMSECRPHRLAGAIPSQPRSGSTGQLSLNFDFDPEQPSTSRGQVRDWRTMSRDSSFDFAECSIMGTSHFQNHYAHELDVVDDLEHEHEHEHDQDSVDSLRHYRTA